MRLRIADRLVELLYAEGAEEGAEVFGEELGLFPGGEVASAGHFGPALDVVAALDPGADGKGIFLGEAGDGRGDGDALAGGEVEGGLAALEVEAEGGRDGLG